jgi:hypothetical protein
VRNSMICVNAITGLPSCWAAGWGGARRPRMRPSSRPLPAVCLSPRRAQDGGPANARGHRLATRAERTPSRPCLLFTREASHVQSGCRECERDVEPRNPVSATPSEGRVVAQDGGDGGARGTA